MTKTDYTAPFKFTKGSINGIPSGDKLAYFYDTEVPKLGITRQASGNKNFHVRKVIKGRTQRVSLKDGRWPDMAVDIAREKATELLADVIRGADPVQDKRAQKAVKAVTGLTVKQAVEDYLEAKRTGKQKLPLKDGTKGSYRKTIKYLLGDDYESSLTSITEDLIAKRVKAITPAQGATGCRSLSAVWNWTRKQKANRGLIPANPVTLFSDDNDGLYIPQPRQNHIKEAYVGDWFNAVEGLEAQHSEFLLFLVLTGVRMNEARLLDWKDIDFKAGFYTLPDPKNRQKVELPLPRYLKEKLLARRKKSGRVFNVGEKVYQMVDVGQEYSHHDLRRTFATYGFQVCDFVKVKMMMNHIISGVTADYVQVSPDALAREHHKVEGEILRLAGRTIDNVRHLEAVS
jgi:site-specific recombinase XerD